MDQRQAKLLHAIIDQFITTALPVGSQRLLQSADFSYSSATIRSEMSSLEEEGFLQQPHVSAGRIPTVKGYREYVQFFMKPTSYERAVRAKFDVLREQYFQHKDRERAFEAVSLLSQMTANVCFATVPHRENVYYMGLANTLRQPEFQANPLLASGVVEVLEKRLSEIVAGIEVDEQVRYYIGEKQICPQFESCSLMLTRYRIRDYYGVLGVLGPVRMDYGYNTVALDMVAGLLRDA